MTQEHTPQAQNLQQPEEQSPWAPPTGERTEDPVVAGIIGEAGSAALAGALSNNTHTEAIPVLRYGEVSPYPVRTPRTEIVPMQTQEPTIPGLAEMMGGGSNVNGEGPR